MGLTIHFELDLPPSLTEAEVTERIATLRAKATELSFVAVSDVVRLDRATLAGPWPLEGLGFKRLEDVAHVSAVFTRDALYAQATRDPHDETLIRPYVEPPPAVDALAIGFAVVIGEGCEPAAFGVVRLGIGTPRWAWECSCKTQYASIVSDAHFVQCHTTIVALLDAAVALGFAVNVEDDADYWATRDAELLLARLDHMNRLVARLAGTLTDAIRAQGGDTRTLGGEIFAHPDFERLETRGPVS